MLIPFEKIVRKYGIQPRGVLHLGAHIGEEAKEYHRLGVQDVLWVEANPDLMDTLRGNVEPLGHRVFQGVVSASPGLQVEFKITNNMQSSSYLSLGTHARHYPDIEVIQTVAMETTTVEQIYRELGIAAAAFDFVNLDLQGSELDALVGMGPLLDQFQTVYTEVNKEPLYANCPLLPELDRFLREHGFRRRAIRMSKKRWGDALYVRGPVRFWDRLLG